MKLRLSRHAKLQLDFRLGTLGPDGPIDVPDADHPRHDAIAALEAAWDTRSPEPPRWYRKNPGRKGDANIVYLVATIRNVECVAPVAVDRRLVITVVPRNIAREARNLAQTGRTWTAATA